MQRRAFLATSATTAGAGTLGPPPIVPESPLSVALPVTGVAIAAGAALVMGRRGETGPGLTS